MTRACWWLVAMLSRSLEDDERDAVLGDLAESGARAGEGLRDIVGLVARRQAALWQDWRPWVALVALVLPIGLLNSLHSLDRPYGLYLWVLRNYNTIDPAILQQTGLTRGECIASLVAGSLLLGCFSWINGYVLTALSRRTVWVNGTLFCILPLLTNYLAEPSRQPYPYDVDGWVFPLMFYTTILPVMLLTVLVLSPAVWGMRQGLREAVLSPGKTILWAFALIATLVIRDVNGWPLRSKLLVASHWPVIYLVALSIRQHWRDQRTVST